MIKCRARIIWIHVCCHSTYHDEINNKYEALGSRDGWHLCGAALSTLGAVQVSMFLPRR